MAINIFMTLGHHILGSHIRDRSIQSSLHLGIVSLVSPLLNAFRARLSSLIISIPRPPRINGHQYYTLSFLWYFRGLLLLWVPHPIRGWLSSWPITTGDAWVLLMRSLPSSYWGLSITLHVLLDDGFYEFNSLLWWNGPTPTLSRLFCPKNYVVALTLINRDILCVKNWIPA